VGLGGVHSASLFSSLTRSANAVMVLGQAESGVSSNVPWYDDFPYTRHRKVDASETIPALLCIKVPRRRAPFMGSCHLFEHHQGCANDLP